MLKLERLEKIITVAILIVCVHILILLVECRILVTTKYTETSLSSIDEMTIDVAPIHEEKKTEADRVPIRNANIYTELTNKDSAVDSKPLQIETVSNESETIIKPIEEPATITAESKVVPEDVEIMARVLNGEAGSNWISDTTIYYVGSVVLNRVNSKSFPSTLRDVVFQPGQYACTWDGNYNRTPSERYYRIAEDLLTNGSILPSNVLYQANFKQGSGVYEYRDTLYFCY